MRILYFSYVDCIFQICSFIVNFLFSLHRFQSTHIKCRWNESLESHNTLSRFLCGIPKLKYSKLNGPWYCNKKSKFLIVIQTKNLKERRYEREMSFNDWFNLLCIEGQSSKCRSDADHPTITLSCCLSSKAITSRLLLLRPDS